MMAFLLCMLFLAGFIDSAAGGGGLISLPAYLFAGLSPHLTYGTNKFSAACGTTFSTLRYLRSGAMEMKTALLAALGSFAGSALGVQLVLLLSAEARQTPLLIILPVAAVLILWRRDL
ncbi:MAG: TSUP family transporter, partial [Faecalibacterium sp.]|nr:TSUP family transporter [Faecalibacterium sp.]